MLRSTIPVLLLISVAACSPIHGGGEATPTRLPAVATPGSQAPRLAPLPEGGVLLSWLEPAGDGVALRYATLEDDAWSEPYTVAYGNDWFVNWADFPSIVAVDDSLWAAHWLVKAAAGTYEYDVAMSLSTDGGESWSEPTTPHTDGTLSEHGFVSLFPHGEGVGALWLDGRETRAGGGMTLRSATVLPGGKLQDERLADDLVCDCCQTDVALTRQGPVAAYRNRSPDEIRDIYVMRMIDGEWEAGRPVAEDGWEIAGCPVNGPAIAARGDAVAVTWFTAAENASKVRLAFSTDGAATFGAAVDVATDSPIGRVGLVLLENNAALVSWLQQGDNGEGVVRIRAVFTDGALGKAATVATTSAGRMSGFPQIVRFGDEILIAWTDSDGESLLVRSALYSGHALASRP